MKPTDPQTRAARALQAVLGLVTASLGVGAFDWRAGVVTFGLILLATSGVWRISS